MALDEQQVTPCWPVAAGRNAGSPRRRGRRGLETGDMAAELGGFRVRPQHDGQGVPPDQRPDAVVDRQLPRAQPVFLLGRDRVEVRRRGAVRDGRPLAAGLRDHLVQQEERTVRTLVGQNRIEGLSPFTVSAGSRSSSISVLSSRVLATVRSRRRWSDPRLCPASLPGDTPGKGTTCRKENKSSGESARSGGVVAGHRRGRRRRRRRACWNRPGLPSGLIGGRR